ncbi:MAG: hypothetical protein KatS3mg010_0499 [Acidimicrobiia bacterium]|nr:MAG: hypothetical protein KatS3mg010_0499 [Acidimicrobiia bacterium]
MNADRARTGAGPELRFDPLLREWVNVVGHRQRRPNLPTEVCPFCPGGLEAPEPYDVRWFPNRWPALSPGAAIDTAAAEAAGTVSLPAVGATEVVLFAPRHDASLATLGVAQVRKVVDLWAERTAALLARPEVEYVLVFENRGRERRCDDRPSARPDLRVPVRSARARQGRRGRALPRLPGVRRGAGRARGGRARRRPPWRLGRVRPVRVGLPVRDADRARPHHGSLADLADDSRDALSALLVDALGRYDRLWPPPEPGYLFPYLLWFHQAPATGGDEWHVHAHTAPPLRAPGVQRYVASGELGSGTLSNPVVPEDAAKALRDA